MEQLLRETLKKYWGYDDFRPMQREIIESVMNGRDTLALMPTGGGKSITYQLPTLAGEGLCIVVTPLIALMKDQVDRLRRMGISAVAVHSGLSVRQMDIALDNCVYGDVRFLYLAPERLASETFRLRVQRMNVTLIAVDEAHCISQWGYDFRPAYLRIAEVRRLVPQATVLALTASATQRVADDIMDKLGFAEPHIMRSSFRRKNLSYSVRHVEDKEAQLMRIVENVEGSGIVYVRLREAAERVAAFLSEQGVSASYYHGGLPYTERGLRQDEWVSGKVRVMVATNAFGMGIDKADVRFVVHYSMCDSLESYYQEAGRAGRDGQRSYAVLLVAPDDESRLVRHFEAEFPSIDEVRNIYDSLCSYLQVAIGDGASASFIFNIHEYCAREKLYVGRVASALKLLQQNGYLTFVEESDHPARLMFMVSRDDLYKVRLYGQAEDDIMRTILRLYNGLFTEFRAIDEMEIASLSHRSYAEVHEFLKRMWRLHVVRYIPSNHSPMIFFDEERLPKRDVYIAPETYSVRKELMLERFNHMLRYASSDDECRCRIIEEYFCGEESEPCGICDNCLARRRSSQRPNVDIKAAVIGELGRGRRTVKELVASLEGNEEALLRAVQQLLAEGRIAVEGDNGELALRG